MVYADLEWLVPLIALIGFVIGFLITFRQQKVPGIGDVIDTITTKYLDERGFRLADLKNETGLPDPVIQRVVKALENEDIIYRKKTGWFQLNDPLIFLSEKDMIRASRLTKDDNLLYGGYQNPFFSHVELLVVYGIFIGAVVFAAICFFIDSAKQWLWTALYGLLPVNDLELGIFLLFLIMIGMIATDAIENLIQIWGRERFSVVIAEHSGIAFDASYSDEFSGRIGRGRIRKVDLQIRPIQKFLNYFMRVPIGDVRICCASQEELGQTIKPVEKGGWVTFKNLPFPREIFFILRSLQLKSLGWRKQHARTLMLWRAKGAIPSIRF